MSLFHFDYEKNSNFLVNNKSNNISVKSTSSESLKNYDMSEYSNIYLQKKNILKNNYDNNKVSNLNSSTISDKPKSDDFNNFKKHQSFTDSLNEIIDIEDINDEEKDNTTVKHQNTILMFNDKVITYVNKFDIFSSFFFSTNYLHN